MNTNIIKLTAWEPSKEELLMDTTCMGPRIIYIPERSTEFMLNLSEFSHAVRKNHTFRSMQDDAPAVTNQYWEVTLKDGTKFKTLELNI